MVEDVPSVDIHVDTHLELEPIPGVKILRPEPLPKRAREALQEREIDHEAFLNTDDILLVHTPVVDKNPSFTLGANNTKADISLGPIVATDHPDSNPIMMHTVSRVHAKVTVSPASVEIADQGSTNGTYIQRKGGTDWEKVTAPVRLTEDDRVRLGYERLGVILQIARIPPPKDMRPFKRGWMLRRCELDALSAKQD